MAFAYQNDHRLKNRGVYTSAVKKGDTGQNISWAKIIRHAAEERGGTVEGLPSICIVKDPNYIVTMVLEPNGKTGQTYFMQQKNA